MKERNYVSRRQRVIRRLIALGVLAVLFLGTGLYRIFPSQAIQDAEKKVDCGKTAILYRLGYANLKKAWPNQMYISYNDKALVFTVARLTPRSGWILDDAAAVDCAAETPLHAGIYEVCTEWSVLKGNETWETTEEWIEMITNQYRFGYLCFAYGRVDDPTAVLVRVKACYEVDGELETVYSVDIPQSEWYHKDGRIYFAAEFYRGEGWLVDTSVYTKFGGYQAELLDAAGNVLYRNEKIVYDITRLSPPF